MDPAFLMPIATAFAAGPRGQFQSPPPGRKEMWDGEVEDYSEFLICNLYGMRALRRASVCEQRNAALVGTALE